MTIAATTTIGELASRLPRAIRIFEKHGIDYCCGGTKSLAEACDSAGVRVEEVISEMDQEAVTASLPGPDDTVSSLRRLIDYITRTHHTFTRNELGRLAELLHKVIAVHGERHPELVSVQNAFRELSAELMPHLLKEENVLFPYIAALEAAAERGMPSSTPPFITVGNPVRMMMFEHEKAGGLLRELRSMSSNYTAPADACVSYRTLYAALEDFERDLHQHIHLENNILFPRAIEIEASQLEGKDRRVS
jgi:regulator of cell morphogenesis and NO signaling